MADWASESGHWYQSDGTPCYEVSRADGKGMRQTTLRDARKLGLYPGVTTIIRCAAAPGLEAWKRKQLALACLTLPKYPDESLDAFLERAEADARREGEASAAKGTIIHGQVERWYRGEPVDHEWGPWVEAVVTEIANVCGVDQVWSPEKAVAHPSGYGTKIDLHSKFWTLDFKTKDGIDDVQIWDEHRMQIGAGTVITGPGHGGIVFIDRNSPRAKLIEMSVEEIAKGWGMFSALLAYWQIKNSYKP